MTPPRSAFKAARGRTVTAVTAMNYGLITYLENDYEAAVSVDGEGYELGDLGTKVVQRLRAAVRKCLMVDRPVRGKMIHFEGLAFEIELVAGDGEGIPDWEITAFRVPGADL
jgi:hypothetical protein